MSKSCVNLFYEFATLYMGRGGILETLLKITIILCQWLSEIYQKKKKMKNEVLCMLFTITQMYFNEFGYVRLHSIMNIMTENGAKMTNKIPQ